MNRYIYNTVSKDLLAALYSVTVRPEPSEVKEARDAEALMQEEIAEENSQTRELANEGLAAA